MKKIPDRLNYSIEANKILKKIDDSNYFMLSIKEPSGVSRSEIFLFAMALGFESDYPRQIKNLYRGGLVLDGSIDNKTKAAMYAQFIFKLFAPEDELDEITRKADVYKLAENYANSGFKYLADYMEKKNPDTLMWDLFKELDDKCEELQIAQD